MSIIRISGLLTMMLLSGSSSVMACSCFGSSDDIEGDVTWFFATSTSVVTAKAESVEDYWSPTREGREFEDRSQRVVWRVLDYWKGPHRAETTFRSDTQTDWCGGAVKQGEVQLLYLHRTEPYVISGCNLGWVKQSGSRHRSVLESLKAKEASGSPVTTDLDCPPSAECDPTIDPRDELRHKLPKESKAPES